MSQTRVLAPTPSAYPFPLLIKQLLLSGRRYESGREIVYRDRVRYDYNQLNERICRLANALKASGIGPGDVVAVMEWDSHRYLEAMFAIPMIGAIIHTINVRLSPDQIIYTVNHAEDKLILVNDEFLPLLKGMHDQFTTVENYLLISDNDDAQVPSDLPFVGEYEALLAAQPAECEFPDFDENSVATTFYTTGTTGNPKGVYFTHRQLVLHTLVETAVMGGLGSTPLMNSDDVYMPVTPMFHVHAWGVPYVATMMGIKQVYPGRYEPDLLVDLQQREGVTYSHCVPAIIQMIMGCKRAQEVNFSGWKVLIGGSALNKGLALAALEKGIKLSAAYGMSETCPLLSAAYVTEVMRDQLSDEEQMDYRIAAGVPVPLVQLEVVDGDGKFQPHDGETVGEVVVRAPWLTQAYFKEPEKSEELWANGWLHTGDVATIDELGIVRIRDRIKDVIKTGGEWISSLELEGLMSLHPAIAEVAVVGVPDPQWDERPFALVVVKPGEDVDAASIKKHLKQYVDEGRINKWAIPTQIAVVESIPKTSVGKLNKKQIRADYADSLNGGGAFLSSV
ncbi:fatty acid--CoA ligase [Aestuariirhabdus litorea]|uniref:Fatty acid--CoA ligase n=1 Tax=Aestuariirhabdus litorea TaxID=2528527 RepID=A0A3P3VNQ0_9GAMM|nr:fatty acid--CoA ligase [Aestuariirhabdus litorea]RRJ83276.1 fatty acid--CoA ligase [Aestuariirhabdus litorea]RWW93435.1 long-chain-fatty-acid--CoA ligase [Endozoicomonadaceae bacterium GTF-13]